MLLFSGNSNPSLAKNIATVLGTTLGLANISLYSDGESKIAVSQNVKDQDVFIIQPTSFPVNSNILILCLLANLLKNKQARSITAVIPYFGYGRHDGDFDNGHCSAKLILQLLVTAGVNRVLTLDLHSKRLQSFSGLKLKTISTALLFVSLPQIKQLPSPVIVAPDMGAVTRAREFAKLLGNATVVIINKIRNSENQTTAASIIGNVANRNCIIVDDIIDTGNTIYATAKALKQQGALQIYACCTHAVFSGKAIQLLQQSHCERIFITDSINSTPAVRNTLKFNYVSVAGLLATAIVS